MNRKLRKLAKNPHLFFEDMVRKRFGRLAAYTPKVKKGFERYTVVSAVYNVSEYLDDFFSSLVSQRLDFRKNIMLIMVDDGSTDSSAEIIHRWKKRYPENIIYLHKENGGQSSARNQGLEHVATEWVTFIDPDDFVAHDYFSKVDAFIEKHNGKHLAMVSCNFIFYHEGKKQYSNTHPLNYRFVKGDRLFPVSDLGQHMQLSVNSVFFRNSLITERRISFDARVKPNFEDGHFVGLYLKELHGETIGFASQAEYFYRKRSDSSSTLDTSWEKKEHYVDVLRYGYLDLMHRYEECKGYIPKSLQRTVLYDLIWHIKKIVNHPETCFVLTEGEQSTYIELLDACFSFIDIETIIEFELAGCWFYHKVGMLNAFMNAATPFQIAYIEEYDATKQLIQLRYFAGEIGFERFRIGNRDIIPAYIKTMRHDFLERTFVLERRVWLPVQGLLPDAKLCVDIGEHAARLSLAGKQHKGGVHLGDILKHFNAGQKQQAQDLWVFMDRDTQADDNAEHLYRYLMRQVPKQPVAFVLRRDSHDWKRLEEEGFSLLDYSSPEHESALRRCSTIISSHADHYVVDYFNDGSLRQKHFVFLQHGLTKDDLSAWLNRKKIDCFITSAEKEQESMAGDFNRYKFSKKEVVMTGFPRHDALIHQKRPDERILLIMPTWRKSLLKEASGGNYREKQPDFMQSDYALSWNKLLQDSDLHSMAEQSGFRIVFFPHANIQPYLEDFDIPSCIEVMTHADVSIQELFLKSTCIITDYSSVAFEMALLKKAVVYYQFDADTLLKRGFHIYQRGYFDYSRDGFGPVVTTNEELIFEVRKLLENRGRPAPCYLERMESFFPFRDGQNCERVFQAIRRLSEPLPEDYLDTSILKSFAMAADAAGQWKVSEERWRYLIDSCSDTMPEDELRRAQKALAKAMQMQSNDILRHVQLAIVTIEGILTDGSLYCSEDGQISMRLLMRDLTGITMLQHAGIQVVCLTCIENSAAHRVLSEIGIEVYSISDDTRVRVCRDIIENAGVGHSEVLFAGNDLHDLPVFTLCGVTCTAMNAPEYLCKLSSFTLSLPGGSGAFRELADMILTAKGNGDVFLSAEVFRSLMSNELAVAQFN